MQIVSLPDLSVERAAAFNLFVEQLLDLSRLLFVDLSSSALHTARNVKADRHCLPLLCLARVARP